MSGIFDIFLLYNFVRRLTTPFKDWDAYKKGVIDAEGRILIPKQDRNYEQGKTLSLFDVLVMNLKKLLLKVPGGSSRLATFGAALYLIREDVTPEITLDEFKQKLDEYIDIVKAEGLLLEDAPANATGASVAGLNDGIRFAGAKVFEVEHDKMWKSRFGKKKYDRYARYVGEDEVGDEIRQYARANPKEDIVLKDSKTGAMMFLRRNQP
jgi:hypothetical protein